MVLFAFFSKSRGGSKEKIVTKGSALLFNKMKYKIQALSLLQQPSHSPLLSGPTEHKPIYFGESKVSQCPDHSWYLTLSVRQSWFIFYHVFLVLFRFNDVALCILRDY